MISHLFWQVWDQIWQGRLCAESEEVFYQWRGHVHLCGRKPCGEAGGLCHSHSQRYKTCLFSAVFLLSTFRLAVCSVESPLQRGKSRMLTPTVKRDVGSLWICLIIYISKCSVNTLRRPPPLLWWSVSHATLYAVTTTSAKPFHRLLVQTASPTPGVCKVNKYIPTIIFPLFTTPLRI